MNTPPETQRANGELTGTVGVYAYRSMDPEGPRVETALVASLQENGTKNDCTTIEEGLCTRRDCARGHGIEGDHLDAGGITATSGGRTLALEPESEGQYRVMFGEGALWEADSPIVIEAEGGSVPGFRVELVGPAHVVVTEPVLPRGATLLIDREAPFELEWESALDGNVVAILSSESRTAATTITCNYPVEQGAGFISSALFAGLNPDNLPMRMNVGVLHSERVDTGGRLIDVVAFAGAMTRGGSDVSYSLRFR